MQMVAGMTVRVEANGVSEALYNGQRDRVVEAIRLEMEKQKALDAERFSQLEYEMEAQRKCAERERKRIEENFAVEREHTKNQLIKQNEQLKRAVPVLFASRKRRRNPVRYVKDGIAVCWAILYTVTVGGAWRIIGRNIGYGLGVCDKPKEE